MKFYSQFKVQTANAILFLSHYVSSLSAPLTDYSFFPLPFGTCRPFIFGYQAISTIKAYNSPFMQTPIANNFQPLAEEQSLQYPFLSIRTCSKTVGM